MSPAFASGGRGTEKTLQYQGRKISGARNEPGISHIKSTTTTQQIATSDLVERWFPYTQFIRTVITNLSTEHHVEMIYSYAITSTSYNIKI
jgi:hypothetical protein